MTLLSTDGSTNTGLTIGSSTIPAVIAVAAFISFAVFVLLIRRRVVAGTVLAQRAPSLFGLQAKPPQLWKIRMSEPFTALDADDVKWEHLEVRSQLAIMLQRSHFS